jgi:hypothetical protein
MHRELVLHAVLMAVRRRRLRGTMIHLDQGTQFRCEPTYLDFLDGAQKKKVGLLGRALRHDGVRPCGLQVLRTVGISARRRMLARAQSGGAAA